MLYVVIFIYYFIYIKYNIIYIYTPTQVIMIDFQKIQRKE